MGLLFYPRGGSAHVARNLATALPHAGWDATIVSGRSRSPNHPGDARSFYADLEVCPVDMTRALEARDPMAADPPLHPSYEDREDAPDRVFALLDDDQAEHQVAAWARALQSVGAANFDVLHLHHLTPLYEAAARVAPNVPIVGHLHGTELLMLEAIENDPQRWPYGEQWAQRLRDWAHQAQRLIVLTETASERAERLLGIDADRTVHVANGFNPEHFGPRHLDHAQLWRRMLTEAPRGWEPDGMTLRYEDLSAFEHDTPVLLYVGRFTEVKRIPLLIEAYERARPGFKTRAPLVIVGGFPGEWEGEHPYDAIRRTHARDVFLAGWHDHPELADILAASDVLVLPSVREQFGQVIVEAMACGVPPIAVDAFGPADIVDHGQTGWLVEPDDVDQPGQRARRGRQPARRAAPARGQRRGRRARALRLAGAGPAGGRGLRRRALTQHRCVRMPR